MTEPIRVVLADDHPVVREGIRLSLVTEPDMLVVGVAADGTDVQRLCVEVPADVLVLDVRMPGPPTETIVQYVHQHCPTLKILVMTAYHDEAIARRLVVACVAGYMLKEEALEAMVHAIRSVAHGGSWFSSVAIRALVEHTPNEIMSPQSALTVIEVSVLRLVAQGSSDNEIAAVLGIAERTVRKYMTNIRTKLQAENRVQCAVKAVRLGLA